MIPLLLRLLGIRIFGKNISSLQKQLTVPQNVLWRAKNLFIPPSVTFIVVHCCSLFKGILNIGKSLLEKAPKSNIILTGILPRDEYKSKRRNNYAK